MRPGMYIGKLGDGSSPDDGIYILLKEVMDNCIDEFYRGHVTEVKTTVLPDGKTVIIEDNGIGFTVSNREGTEGLGLKNIKTRMLTHSGFFSLPESLVL